MNARNYRVNVNLSPIDFPALNGLGLQSTLTFTERPGVVNSKLALKITKTLLLTDVQTNKGHEILKVQSIYEVPIKNIKTKEDLYEFYKYAELFLNEAYQYAQATNSLPPIQFSPEPIENYQEESESVFAAINSLN